METRKKANLIRQDIIRLIRRAGTGHTAHNLGAADIFTTLYFKILNHNPRQPNWQERDRVFASAHYAPAWRTTLAHAGYFARKNLFQGSQRTLPGTLSMAVGSALAAQIDGKKHHTYCVISDHDLHNGDSWEAMLIAGKYQPAITLIIDRSNLQADGYAETILPLEPLRQKLESFNWKVIEVDGHNSQHIEEALAEAKTRQPAAIIAHTIAGKGISFIENSPEWHEKAPSEEEEKTALAELQKQ
ncbi:MAG: 1-deoxy-D-xylulose-5-phosphate synthase N-terminal domain-containing protein [Candidatus Woesearchaeota archaeon]